MFQLQIQKGSTVETFVPLLAMFRGRQIGKLQPWNYRLYYVIQPAYLQFFLLLLFPVPLVTALIWSNYKIL
jgi:hypothetical protein